MPNSKIRAVLTDIEGTTSSISFVKDVLFPFARQRLAGFIAEHRSEPDVQQALDDTRTLAGEPGLDEAATIALLTRWIDEDRKATPLKALQGMIWKEGYHSGRLKGDVYPDAAEYLARWRNEGLALYVYSSGSVLAQKLIFGHTELGDLTPLFSGYFDTAVGTKTDHASYAAIAEVIGLPASEILFLSDNISELDAAAEIGMATIALDRGEVVIPEGQPHAVAKDFSEIDAPAGRLKDSAS
jgi:enolase-phosphatase E1